MTAEQIISQWNSMTDKEQFTFCQNCVKREIKQGGKLKPGMEFDDAVQNTAERLLVVLDNPAELDADTERRESEGKTTNTLEAIACRAAHSSMVRMAYHSDKDSKATRQTITTEDGSEIDILDAMTGRDNVEDTAIFRVTLRQFIESLDEMNQKIFSSRIQGMTEREISEIVFISNVAVHNRLVKMQKSLATMLN